MLLKFLLSYVLRYMIVDFLLDNKDKIAQLQKKLEKVKDEKKRILIKSQIEIYYQQGLEVLARFKDECPKSVKDYFLGYSEVKPDYKEISKDCSDMRICKKESNLKIVFVSLAVVLGIFIVFYLFGL